MRPVLRRIFLVLLLLAGLACFAYWWIMRRTFPEHALYIPANASYVITINLREVGKDLLQGGSGDSNTGSGSKNDTTLTGILRERKGSGIALLSDVLVFACPGSDSTPDYQAAVLKLSDAAEFSDLLHTVVQKKVPGEFSENENLHCWISNEKKIMLAWNEQVAVVVQHKFDVTTQEPVQNALLALFKQSRAQSICSNADFVKHQDETFDIGFWADGRELQKHPPSLAMTFLPETETPPAYVHGIVRFVNGNIGINLRSDYTGMKKPAEPKELPMLMNKPESCFAYWQGNLGPEKNFRGNMMGNWLQDQTRSAQAIRECLGGYYSVALHDTVHYWKRFLKNEYDENFNMVEVRDSAAASLPGITCCFEVSNRKRLDTLLTEWAAHDSLHKTNTGYLRLRGDYPFYVAVQKDRLLVSSLPGKIRGQVQAKEMGLFQNISGFAEPPRLAAAIPSDSLMMPEVVRAIDATGKSIKKISWSPPVWVNEVHISETRIEFTDPGTNGLTQLLKLLGGIK